MEEFLRLARLVFESFHPSVFFGLGVWIGSAIIQKRLISKRKIYNRGRKKIRAAEEAGHVVHAVLDRRSTHFDRNSGNTRTTYYGRYIYSVNGKHYRKVLRSNRRNFSETITLYFFSRPSKAKTAGELTFWDDQILPMIVPLLLGVLTLLAAGYPIE